MLDTPRGPNGTPSTAIAATLPPPKLPTIEEKPAETKRPSEYGRYLQSPRWRTLARAVRMRAKGKCEICLRANGEECAHLTYERIFNERMTDLLWVCRKCHRELDHSQQM